MPFHRIKNQGFSLIELLLYTAVVVVVVGLSAGILYVISRSNSKNIALNEVNNNLRFMQETIKQKIESATGINSISGSSLSLATASSSTNPTLFSLSNNIIYMKEGSGVNQAMNSFKVNVDSLSFTLSPPALVNIDPYNHWARNPNYGYVDFGSSYGGVKVPVGAGDLSGIVHNSKLGWISLNCATTDQCSEVSYKVSSDASGNLSGNALSIGNGLYVDADTSGAVSINDQRLAIGSGVSSGYGFTKGSLVAAGNGDIASVVTTVSPASNIKSTGANGEFTYGTDGLYVDLDGSATITVNDRRVSAGNTVGTGSGYAPGTIVASGDADLTTALLPVSASAHVVSTNTSGNFNYSEGLISFSGVTVNQTTGIFGGKATTTNVGYISFNCATGGSSNENICTSYDYKVGDLRQRISGIKTAVTITYKDNRPEYQVSQTANFSANLKLPSAVTVTAINPSSGANTGTVNITSVSGTNFQTGALVKLVRSGQPDIYPSTSFTFTSSSQLSSGVFDITSVQKGTWDVIVINPDGQSDVLVTGFTVN